jgi:hypothetical protein
MWYWIYTEAFRCFRRIYKILKTDISVPLPTRDPVWLSITANKFDGTDEDITDRVRLVLREDEVVTPWRLVEITGLTAKSWSYLTKTLEYNIIPSHGVNNGL